MSEQQILLSPAAARGDKLSWATRIAYGGGDTACNVVFGMIGTVLTLFYTDYVGISIATVGLVMLISRLFDGVSDAIKTCPLVSIAIAPGRSWCASRRQFFQP